jgi:hypothetical protein
MRCMAELHVSTRREPVHPHPRDLNVLVSVSDDFLHFWTLLPQLGVTQHAFSNRRNAGGIASIGSNMAVDTL